MSTKEVTTINNNIEYDRLLLSVGETLEQGRQQAVYAVNSAMVHTYWEIGRQIVEYEQHGSEKAEYGSGLLNQLSKDLTIRYGSGFSLSNINKMRKMYLTYPILQTLSARLTWSHYVELLKIDDPQGGYKVRLPEQELLFTAQFCKDGSRSAVGHKIKALFNAPLYTFQKENFSGHPF